MAETAHPDLHHLLDELREIYTAMADFGSAKLAAKPPILDSSMSLGGDSQEEFHSHQDAVQGLRALREAVKRDMDALDKFLSDPECSSKPPLSTNAPYLISVWNEVLNAPPPIVTIWRTFAEVPQLSRVTKCGSRKPPGVKVDVVADGGKRWIRVNTMKNSRLLAEFREIDSYLTDSEDDHSDEEARPSLALKEFDNSILRMGRSLLGAARRNALAASGVIPSVTLRLTRLDPSPSNPREYDARIAKTIQVIRDMGIDIELGERSLDHISQVPSTLPRRLEPTIRVNLDLSILIALVSDITHSPLPTSPVEAEARYVPSSQNREWKRKRTDATKSPNREADEALRWEDGVGEHSRALANQALQEMSRGLLHELRDRLAAASSSQLQGVEFWTTSEARDRCLRIVLSKIGGPNERRRVAALFHGKAMSVSEAEDAYWASSRYPRAFLPLFPIRIFESQMPPQSLQPPRFSETGRILSPFFPLLVRTCRDILAQETPSSLDAPPPTLPAPQMRNALSIGGGHDASDPHATPEESETIERAAVTKANPRLTAHTVQSMLWGAARGWTTLTANKSSVKAILRDIRGAEGGYGWFDESQVETRRGNGTGEAIVEAAAFWVVDPRSLAEGMRSDYEK
ncbi:hypothetical protein C8Q79DRAFT_900550 [Trametes meyenii]|nr:hypothetical protein C8Q79DRAFT_900550 [Trametes meyenii]